MWFEGHSKSLKIIPFESMGMVSYSPSIVPRLWLCLSISVIKRNKNLAIAYRSRVSWVHNTLRVSIGLNITPWPWHVG